MKKYISLFILFVIFSCTDRTPEPVYTNRITNLSNHNLVIKTYKNGTITKTIPINNQNTYEVIDESSRIFNYNDDIVSLVFDDGKILNYQYTNRDIQTINNPYSNGFVCEGYICTYTITNDDYNRAE